MSRWVMFVVPLVIYTASCGSQAPNNAPDTMPTQNKFTSNLSPDFVSPNDDAAWRIYREYGAVLVAKGGAIPPHIVAFKDDDAVRAFQSLTSSSRQTVAGVDIELQAAAMKGLLSAIEEARLAGRTITPRGDDAAKRSYAQTVELWASRVEPGLTHWVEKGRVSAADAERIRALSPWEQVAEIFRLEAEGIYFSKDLSKTIIYSVAPPGTSQHLSMLALDVTEHDDPHVRAIMANHGWFQTVVSDLPHFTFLGVKESELPELGLKKVESSGRTFWLPALD